tara:strand:- start:1830 stop:2075 length:246 start_codon:yes stop_codon:yes gene_type:complete
VEKIMEMELTINWKGNEVDANALLQSIIPDDSDMFIANIENDGTNHILMIRIEADSLRQLRATADDVLACLAAAEAVINHI